MSRQMITWHSFVFICICLDSFYLQLENVYECFPGVNPIATLENYGSLERSNLTFKSDKMGYVQVNGWFM